MRKIERYQHKKKKYENKLKELKSDSCQDCHVRGNYWAGLIETPAPSYLPYGVCAIANNQPEPGGAQWSCNQANINYPPTVAHGQGAECGWSDDWSTINPFTGDGKGGTQAACVGQTSVCPQ
jgi:hypothetical protein